MTERTFGIIPAGMAFDPELGKVALRLGMLLAVHANKSRKCWLATETMARMLDIDRSAVSRGLAELKSRGHVIRERRSIPGRGLTSSVYTLVNRPWPAPEIATDDEEAGTAEETAIFEPKGLGEPLNRSAGLSAEFTPPAPADAPPLVLKPHHRPPPAGADSAHPGGAEAAEPLVQHPHQNQYWNSINDQDDDERAHAREASSSSASEDFSQEGQALLIFDEVAGRLGWPIAGRLTSKNRRAMTDRLREADGLDGWRLAMAKAEASNYLGRTKPGLPFFLAEDTFAQLMRGRYDPDKDPPLRGAALKMARIAALWAGGQPEPEAPTADTLPPAPEPRTKPETRQVASRGSSKPIPYPERPLEAVAGVVNWIAETGAHDKGKVDSVASDWIRQLEASGFDTEEARAIIVHEARWIRKTRITGDPAPMLNSRIAAHAPVTA